MAKTPKEAPAPKEAAPAEAAAETTTAKSIVNPKYRGIYTKDKRDWLALFIDEHCTAMKDVKRTEKTEDGATATKTVQVPDGVDVDKVFALARINHLDVDKYEDQRGSHGFAGRLRMTVRNMLQTVAKQRHGLNGPDGKFVSAPAEWLASKDAPATATHKPDGTKIVVPKAEPAKAAA